MAHTLIQIQSYLFIITQPKVTFRFLYFLRRVPTWYLLLHTIFLLSSLTFWDCKWDPLPLTWHDYLLLLFCMVWILDFCSILNFKKSNCCRPAGSSKVQTFTQRAKDNAIPLRCGTMRYDATTCRISSSRNWIAYLICMKFNTLSLLRLHYDL